MSLQVNDRLLWPNGRRKAFTLSYDDGITQDRRLVDMFNKYAVKATFNLNSGLFGRRGVVSAGKKQASHNKLTAEEIIPMYKDHEVAAHGQYHECMIGMDIARCVEEIAESRKGLEKILGKPVTGFAYAFGAYDEVVMKALEASGISYARTIESTHKFELPNNFLAWNPTCHHDDEKIFELANEFLSDGFYFSMMTPAKLFYVWGHSYEFDQCDNWEHMEKFIRQVSGHEDVWYATNGEVRAYVEAYHRLIYTMDGTAVYNPNAISVYLGGTFSNEYVEVLPGTCVKLIPPIDM